VTRILVDTSALLTLLDADDPRQRLVQEAFANRLDDDLVTHGYVVAESLAVVRRRLGVDGVITLLDDILPAIDVLAVDGATHATAQARYRGSLPSGVSFVDQVTFAVIERESIDTVMVLDADFARPGLTVVPTVET
jgi:predicted nucleic acid-binding protein